MPAKRRTAKTRTYELTSERWYDLWLGRDPRTGVKRVFGSEADRRECWRQHRDTLMEQHAQGGKRPRAFWDYEADQSTIPADAISEADAIIRMGIASPSEEATILAGWRGWIEWSRMRSSSPSEFRKRVVDDCRVPEWFFEKETKAS
jgi:hypothetical protein